MRELRQRIKNKNAFLATGILCTVFSQITPIRFQMRIVMYFVWGCYITYIVASRGFMLKIDNVIKSFCYIYLIYVVYCFICSLLFGSQYINSPYIVMLVIPIFISVIGKQNSDKKNDQFLENVAIVYLVAAVIFAVWVNVTYFASFDTWINQIGYVYSDKNSAGQIWATAAIIAAWLINTSSKKMRIFRDICIAYIVLLICLSQCRTAILALAFSVIFMMLLKSRHRFAWITIIIICIICILNIPFVRVFLDKTFLITTYRETDLNTFSSGRVFLYKKAWVVFLNNPFVGVGNYYVDNFYLNILVTNGIIGFLALGLIWVIQIYRVIHSKCNIKNEKQKLLLEMITLFYLFESLFEAYPPFGPGASSFMYWLLCAIII